MSIAFVQEAGTKTEAAITSPMTVTLSAATTIGNRLFLFIGGRQSATNITGITDTPGNTWAIDLPVVNATSNQYCAIASCQITAAHAISDTVTITMVTTIIGMSRSALLEEFSGIATGTFLDKTSTNTGPNSSSNTGTTAATTNANDLALAIHMHGTPNTSTITKDAAYTDFPTAQIGTNGATSGDRLIKASYRLLSATGTQISTDTCSVSVGWNAGIATYLPAVASTAHNLALLGVGS